MPTGELAALGGTLAVGAAVALLKSYQSGRIRRVLDKRKSSKELGDQAHQQVIDRIEEIYATTKQTDKSIQRVESEVESLGEAIVVLHADDEDVDVDKLREQVGVEDLPTDIKAPQRRSDS